MIDPTGLYKSFECKISCKIPTMGAALLREEIEQTEKLKDKRTDARI
jgi:uncharacterized protein YpuA (DUF1002 family)